mgnify:CR=1 FL=1
MSKTFHTRIINLCYAQEDLPRFETDEETQRWYAAVGSMVLYGMYDPQEQATLQLVNAVIGTNPVEMDAGYFPRVPSTTETWEDGSPKYRDSPSAKVENFLAAFRNLSDGRAFVMGAVLHSDGKFGFHS